jgi:Ser-tRNA(Ala) deacylase AlaX
MAAAARTHLIFQHDAKLHTIQTAVTAIRPFTALEEANSQLFKDGSDTDYVVITKETIFHPQGGGQPSDVGTMTSASGVTFMVVAVRMDAVHDGQVLHFGRFSPADISSTGTGIFSESDHVKQAIDVDKRLLYSRLHTAGHVLGAAVRHLLEAQIEGFDELKASHFPDSAACEFQGLIEGKWKEPIQKKLDEYIAAKMPVEIVWWDEEDFRSNGVERLIPDRTHVPPGEKFRVVKIVGAEAYPCGGTHVDTTDLCGETKVRKISRSKGQSRVSYAVS